jgi:hypothetical protein
MNGQKYYTYKKGNVRFFALDSNYMNPQQLAWLEKELQGSGSDWKICFFHHTLYSSGRFHGSANELRLLLEPLFVKYGVQVVFAGHEHVYERVKPQKGIYYFTEGASGSLRKGNLKKTDLTAVGYDQDCTFMLVEIAGDELYFQTITRTGATVDSGVIRRVAKITARHFADFCRGSRFAWPDGEVVYITICGDAYARETFVPFSLFFWSIVLVAVGGRQYLSRLSIRRKTATGAAKPDSRAKGDHCQARAGQATAGNLSQASQAS